MIDTPKIRVSDLRIHLSEAVHNANRDGKPRLITSHGRSVGALVPAQLFEQLMKMLAAATRQDA